MNTNHELWEQIIPVKDGEIVEPQPSLEAMMDSYDLDIPVPHVDDRVNKARWHCNPAYRK